MRGIVAFIAIIIIGISGIVSAGNISAYDIGANYIIWDISSAQNVSIDGIDVTTSSPVYTQSDLISGSKHVACEAGIGCVYAETSQDSLSVITHWSVYLLLIIFCVISYYVPVSFFATLIYGLYLIRGYLPAMGAGFEEYILCVSLVIIGFLTAMKGYNR